MVPDNTKASANDDDEDDDDDDETAAYVRYLFDQNLFNVPNNYDRCSFLVTYLKNERVFDVTYAVGNAERRFRDGEMKVRGSKVTPTSPRFQVSASYDRTPNDEPTDREDVRRHLQRVWLSGDDREWLDLKVKLCMPSLIVFFKLAGSTVDVPNADLVVSVSMRDLLPLKDKRSLGEKLSVLMAAVRADYFGRRIPDFHDLAVQHAAMLGGKREESRRKQPQRRPMHGNKTTIDNDGDNDDNDGIPVTMEDVTLPVQSQPPLRNRDILHFGGGHVLSVQDVS